jgi:uncharacterized membrane protein (DUF4010 family)
VKLSTLLLIELVIPQFIEKIAVSLAVGALIGMEREYTKRQSVIGVRTFALISLFAALTVMLGETLNLMILVPIGLLAVILLGVGLYFVNLRVFKKLGLTTTLALPLSYFLGIFVGYGYFTEAVFITIAVTFVLFAKARLHKFVEHLEEDEVLDFLEFLALIGILYPILPSPVTIEGLTLDFHMVWMLMVLISLLNLVGFVGSRYLSAKHEIEVVSFLGGLVSTNATSASLINIFKENTRKVNLISSAYAMMEGAGFVRSVILIGFVAPVAFEYASVPLLAGAFILIASGYYRIYTSPAEHAFLRIESPFAVTKAIKLAFELFAMILFLQAIHMYLPEDMFLPGSVLTGMISTTAAVVSLGSLVLAGTVSAKNAALAIVAMNCANILLRDVLIYWLEKAFAPIRKSYLYVLVTAIVTLGLFFMIYLYA